ncbi:MFS transporter TsgA [Enterobacter bugandensis]|uniref:MFS transporter TsgA n=2 Tax=Enterobacter TaxID=547 RepID=UPI000750CB3D|nr:MFS transporter TsgA [Enterobacter bugandensis]KUQ60685.1 transporter [Enterobacter bugandensis]MDE7591784.1 MFS transporter TsgA [Enterobacter bugandensis]MED5644409.1 MFS transporter TsgA [Enterobacter bugandensis]
MSDNNYSRGSLNAVSYLSYYFVGALVSTLGIVLGPLCAAFNKDPSFIGQVFTLMNIGMFVPIMLGGLLMKKWGLQKPLAIAAALTLVVSIVLFTHPTLTLFSVAVALMGACGGIFMTIGSYLVVRINPDEKSRSASLIFTDFFFSLAGATLSFLLAWLFKLGASWMAMYAIMGALGALMLVLVLRARFPTTEAATPVEASSPVAEPWGMSVWLICLSLFLFLLAEPIFTMWTPGYLQWRFVMQPEQAALFTTVYWVTKATGLFINQFTVKLMKLRTFLLICTVVGMISIALIANSGSTTAILIACGCFGFFNSGLFSGLMSYGSLQVSRSSPTLISALLTCGTVGTLLFATVSSLVNSRFGLHGAVNAATVAYAALLLVLLCAVMRSRAERLHHSTASAV